MSQLVGLVIAGAVSGALYAIMASGLVLTYSTSGVFNFAYGAIAYVSALTYYELHSALGLPIVPAALIAVVVFGPLSGWALDRIMFRGLARAGSTAQIVATVGLLIALPALGVWVVERLISVAGVNLLSPNNIVTPPGIGPNPAGIFHLMSGVAIDTNQLATLAAAVVAAGGLWIVTSHTDFGLRMRATVDQRPLASMRGVNPDRTSSAAWSLGTLLAALVGVLGAPILNLGSVDFTLLMLVSASAAVFARLRSIPVAFACGLALGIVENLVAGYLDPKVNLNGLASSVPYLLLFGGLFLLDRRRGSAARVPSEEQAPPTFDADLPAWRRSAPWVVAVVALVVYTLFIADTFWVGLVTSGLCIALIFLSFVVVTGTGGMISLAQATFVTAAALTAGLLISHHVPFLLALLGGTAVATVVGVMVALPALRLGGVPLALATLALAFIGDLLVFQIGAVNNNSLGWTIDRPRLGPLDLHSNKTMAMVVLVVVGLVVLVVRNLNRSSSGRAMFAVRSSQAGAAASGISSTRTRLLVFALSATIAGFGGILYATYSGAVTAGDYPAQTGLIWLAVMVTFGVRRPGYAVVAGLVYAVMPQVLSWVTTSTVVPQILFGLGGISLARSPDGFLAERKERAHKRRMAKRQRVEAQDPAGPVAPTVRVGGERAKAASTPSSSAGNGALEAALELHGVRAGYGTSEVLHGISISLYRGAALGLLGANGAGKSTLCLVASGLLSPTHGAVRLEGDDVTVRPAHWRSRQGLVLAPESRSVFPSLTVDENLRLVLHEASSKDAVYDRFPTLATRRRLAAGLLSGGEQRLLALAPHLMEPPVVLIADEPSLGLAPRVVREVFTLFEELRADGVALLVVEEKMRDIIDFADEVAIMELGCLQSVGPEEKADKAGLAARYLRAHS